MIGIFRYDDEGRLAEEWVQTDYRSFLTKLGAMTTESAPQAMHASRLSGREPEDPALPPIED